MQEGTVVLRIMIADDHGIVREGLRSLIEDAPGMELVAEAADGLETVERALVARPDVLVLDIGMPKLGGTEACARILEADSGIRVLALSMHSERRFIVDALQAGAQGYLLKDCVFDDLTMAIRVVASGRMFLSPDIAGLVVNDYIGLATGTAAVVDSPMLTPREREVLKLVAEGFAAKEIAALLGLSTKTVETHRRQVMEKLDIHSVAELVKYAIRNGLTSLDA